MQPPSPPEYYFGDAYRKYSSSSTTTSGSGSSSGPGSPSSSGSGYVFGSLFVSAESVTPYTDATQVRDRALFSCEAAVNWFLGN